jgi:hypothetical protein
MRAKYLLSPIGYQESLYESEFFRNFTQRREVNQYQRFRTPTDPAFKGQKIFLLKLWPAGFSETSALNYHSTKRQIPEEVRPYVLL